ncbi:hypothetical protein HDU96_004519 [Phlyctochytrium bullatum]|nr:hypothetical protein HDU96_004519 [Phlyctochytrium bullatum]
MRPPVPSAPGGPPSAAFCAGADLTLLHHPYPGATLLLTRTAGTLGFLAAVHFAVDTAIGKKAAEEKGLNKAERIYISEKVCSTINGVVTAFIGLKSLYFFRDYSRQIRDPFRHAAALTVSAPHMVSRWHAARRVGGWINMYTKDFDWVFPWYLGYTLYDMGTMWFQEPKSHWTMWVHHFMGAYGALGMMFGRQMSIFPVYFMVTEATAVFHNMVWYYQTFFEKKPAPPAINSTDEKTVEPAALATPAPTPLDPVTTTLLHLRAASFIILRVWCAPWSIFHAVKVEHLMRHGTVAASGEVVVPPMTVKTFFESAGSMLTRSVNETPWYIGVPGLVMVFGFVMLNGAWTWATVKVARRRLLPGGKKKVKKTSGEA